MGGSLVSVEKVAKHVTYTTHAVVCSRIPAMDHKPEAFEMLLDALRLARTDLAEALGIVLQGQQKFGIVAARVPCDVFDLWVR
jgi:hypothetical protein